MNILKSDSKGFLIADSATDISDAVAGIDGVRRDTSAILALLRKGDSAGLLRRQRVDNPNRTSPQAEGQRRQPAVASASASAAVTHTAARRLVSVPAPSRERDSEGRFVKSASAPVPELSPLTKAVESMTRQQADQHAASERAKASRENRGEAPSGAASQARGRFGSGGGGDSDEKSGGLLDRLKSLSSPFSMPGGGAGDMEKIDPTVDVAKEASQLAAAPLKMVGAIGKATLGRGFNLGGSRDGASPWYRRIWEELRMTRRQGSEFDLVQTRMLKEIERKAGDGGAASSGGGLLGALGGMFGKGGGGLLSGLGGMLGKGGGMLGGLVKGGLKRIPVLGALLAGGSALASIFGGDDPNKSAEENRKDRFTGAGSGIGVLIGGGIGLLGGPAGVVVGGMIGDKVGEMVGEWLSTVDWSKVGAQITGAWDSTVGFFKDSWATVTGKLAEISKTVSDAWNSIVTGAKAFLNDKFGIDIDAITAKAQAATAPLTNAVSGGVRAFVDYSKERVAKMAKPIGRAAGTIGEKVRERWNDAKQYLLGASDKAGVDAGVVAKIANFESGFNADATPTRKDGTKISSAHGYGQFLDGTWTAMVNKYGAKYGIQGAGTLTKEEAAKYRNDKTIQAGMLAEFTRENIEKGRKYGGTDDDANAYAFHNLGDKDAKNLLTGMKQDPFMTVRDALLRGATTDKERARVEAVISGNKSLYGDGNTTAAAAYAQMGQVMRRGEAFAADARGQSVAQTATVQPVAAMSSVAPVVAPPTAPRIASLSVSVPAMQTPPPAAQAAIPLPLNSKEPMQVTIADNRMAGQDVRDRRLAHIASGGLGV